MPYVVDIIVRKKKEKIVADSSTINVHIGDRVIVQMPHGLEVGTVISNERLAKKPLKGVRKILRKFTSEDEVKVKENEKELKKIEPDVREKVSSHCPEMKVVSLEYGFDRSQLFIYFVSQSRVNFRELVKILANKLKVRVQMIQIGVRDETKISGWIGPCGRIVCCMKLLSTLPSITTNMVKHQHLTQDISKLLGICGRLKCCLRFESDYYK